MRAINRVVRENGEFGHYLASVTEINDQKQAEDVLKIALVDTVQVVA